MTIYSSSATSIDLARIEGRRIDSDVPENDQSNFYICSICGQQVYMGNFNAVIHHEQSEHEPLQTNS